MTLHLNLLLVEVRKVLQRRILYYVILYILMPTQKYENRNIRKLTKLGKHSLAVTLPVESVRELGWKEKQKVVVKKVRGGFLVKDWRKKG